MLILRAKDVREVSKNPGSIYYDKSDLRLMFLYGLTDIYIYIFCTYTAGRKPQ